MLGKLSLLVFALLANAAFSGECLSERVSLKGDWGEAAFHVEIADTPDARSRGLMFRETMPASAGMLFVFERPQRTAFWMRNTLIPLDMIFAAEDGTVRTVHHMAQPLDETPIPGGLDIKYVLEINGGIAGMMGIAPETVLQSPLIDQDLAAWPCTE